MFLTKFHSVKETFAETVNFLNFLTDILNCEEENSIKLLITLIAGVISYLRSLSCLPIVF